MPDSTLTGVTGASSPGLHDSIGASARHSGVQSPENQAKCDEWANTVPTHFPVKRSRWMLPVFMRIPGWPVDDRRCPDGATARPGRSWRFTFG